MQLSTTPQQDEHYMRLALQEAQIAYDNQEVPVGAVVVWNNKIIGRGHNQVERLNDSTAHAEMLAMTAAFSTIGHKYLNEATLYVTLEPCLMCCGAMYWSKLNTIVYGAHDDKNGYRKYISNQLPFTAPFHPKTLIKTGILQEECSALMKSFFQARRL